VFLFKAHQFKQTITKWARSIKRDGVTLWFAVKNPDTPWFAKALGLLVVAYALSPVDLIPDFIPILGYVDDLILLPVFIRVAVMLLPKTVLTTSRQQADAWMAEHGKKPRTRWGVVFVVFVWVGVLTIAYLALFA
jgi:uncharacterized membrane protein YkvA (DUF1232 family)